MSVRAEYQEKARLFFERAKRDFPDLTLDEAWNFNAHHRQPDDRLGQLLSSKGRAEGKDFPYEEFYRLEDRVTSMQGQVDRLHRTFAYNLKPQAQGQTRTPTKAPTEHLEV